MIHRTLLLGLFALALLSGCGRMVECTSEITEGNGTFKGQASGRKPELDIKREALRDACDKLCAAKASAPEGCAARCSVDAQVGKMGARLTCSGGKR